MVKVGIIGADTPHAGELVRVLINHPETDLISLYAPLLVGRNLSSHHHGLIGENPLKFTDKIQSEDLDLLIITDKADLSDNLLSRFLNEENMKAIAFKEDFLKDVEDKEVVEMGLSEINRKGLVRNARYAYIPSPSIIPALVALSPLAYFLLLNSDINIEMEIPEEINKEIDIEKDKSKLDEELKKRQSSFNSAINLKTERDEQSERASLTTITMNSLLPLDELEKIYDQIYDDHNFVFLTRNELTTKEVEGTHKIFINLDKPDSETLVIKVVADSRLRGGAGDAVHILNLLFGLHEKTGLHLKPSRF